jgi:hypothetical protein
MAHSWLLLLIAPAVASGLRVESRASELGERARGMRKEVEEMKAEASVVLAQLNQATQTLEEAFAQDSAPSRNATHNATSNGTKNRTTAHAAAAANHTSAAKKHNRTETLKAEQDVLTKLFAHLKSNVMKFNKVDAEGKARHTEMINSLQKRLDRDHAMLKRTNLSKTEHEILANSTRAEEREMKYWSRGRELQHGMFHANLKMTHGLMQRVKTVMEAYKEVLAKGHMDKNLAQAMKRASADLHF